MSGTWWRCVAVLTLMACEVAGAATITVDSADDETPADNGNCTLREAIVAANTDVAVDACPAGSSGLDTIEFSVGGVIALAEALPEVNDDLKIHGPGAEQLDIQGNFFSYPIVGPNTGGIFEFQGVSLPPPRPQFELRGLTISNGVNLNDPSSLDGTGGCVSVRKGADLVLDHVVLRNCYSSFRGGAVQMAALQALTAEGVSKLSVLWSHVHANHADGFGGEMMRLG